MTQQISGNDRLFLKDEQGNYYVQTAGMQEPVRVPDENKSEVDEVIQGQVGDVSGFIFTSLVGQQLVTTQFQGVQLSALGRCNGACARRFGVLGQQLR